MNFFHKVFNKFGRYRLIPDRSTGADYMHRYYLFLKDRKWFPFNVTLHKIVRSDDPIFHDHPWPYMTIILKGGYWEHLPVYDRNGIQIADDARWRGPGSIIIRRATELHWLELENGKPATTLFFMGPRQREWGFYPTDTKGKGEWVSHQLYFDNWKEYHEKFVLSKLK